MKRRTFTATMTTDTGARYVRTAYTWNAGIKASEQLVRDYAILNYTMYHGAEPVVTGGKPGEPEAVYSRQWTRRGGGGPVRIEMTETL